MSTRGAHGCVRKMPTGLPDCTSSVSSCSSDCERAHDGVERGPAARRAARSAVHDQILRPLGDVGIEIVHQHPQRGFLRPAFAGERVPRGARMVRVVAVDIDVQIVSRETLGKRHCKERESRAVNTCDAQSRSCQSTRRSSAPDAISAAMRAMSGAGGRSDVDRGTSAADRRDGRAASGGDVVSGASRSMP